MITEILTMGELEVNNYLIIDEETKEAVLIDAGGDFDLTENKLKKHNATLKYILNTHGHMDHIAGNFDIETKLGVKSYLHKDDEILLKYFKQSLAVMGMADYNPPSDIELFEGEPTFHLNNIEIKTIHIPGHTKGSVGYLIDDKLFVGDTLFKECIGRTDMIGGDFSEIQFSIKEKLYKLPDETIVYTGHGEPTSIGYEKKYNYYVKA